MPGLAGDRIHLGNAVAFGELGDAKGFLGRVQQIPVIPWGGDLDGILRRSMLRIASYSSRRGSTSVWANSALGA